MVLCLLTLSQKAVQEGVGKAFLRKSRLARLCYAHNRLKL